MDSAHLVAIGLPVHSTSSSAHSLQRPRSGAADADDKGASAEQLLEWETLQRSLRTRLRAEDDSGWLPEAVSRVGGLDIGFEVGTSRATAVLIICEVKPGGLQLVYEDAIDVDVSLPYVSGFLFVRELPCYRELLARLRRCAPELEPEVFLVDGSGMYHPRELGSASHLGIDAELRTIGVAKKPLHFSDFPAALGEALEAQDLPSLGDAAPIVGLSRAVYGLALRTAAPGRKEASKKRVYVSVGHRLSLASARDVVLRCCDVAGGSYVPEPIRIADLTGRAIERAWEALQGSSAPSARQLIIDVCNLLDDKQRRTLREMLETREPGEVLEAIPEAELGRKRATVEDLWRPFLRLRPGSTVEEARAALRLEKPWAVSLRKAAFQGGSGEAMRAAGA